MVFVSQTILLPYTMRCVDKPGEEKPNWILYKPTEHIHPKPKGLENWFLMKLHFDLWFSLQDCVCGVVLALSLGSTASVKPVPCGSLHPSSPDQHTGFCHQSLSKENQDLGSLAGLPLPSNLENLWASLFGNHSTPLSASPHSQCRHV